MKNIIKALFLTGGVAMALVSCELDEDVYSSIYTDKFYRTASDAEAAIAAAYDPIADMYAGPAALLASDLSADQTYPRVAVSRNALTLFSYDVTYSAQRTAGRLNESPQQIWMSCYDGIEKCNWVIERVPATSMDATRKKEIIGEAYFLRAFYHWTATKNFGDVVVKTKASDVEANAYVGKSPKADVYKQIYLDLDSAVAKLPEHTAGLAKGRPSKQAALALYAKAALYNEDWATSLQRAESVLTNTYLTLMDSVRDIYDVAKEDVARVENIFAFESESINSVSGSTSSRSHQMTGLCGPPGNAAPAYGKTTYGSFFAYQAFFNSFDPNDRRRGMMDTTYVNTAGKIVRQANITPVTTQAVLVKKYQDPGVANRQYHKQYSDTAIGGYIPHCCRSRNPQSAERNTEGIRLYQHDSSSRQDRRFAARAEPRCIHKCCATGTLLGILCRGRSVVRSDADQYFPGRDSCCGEYVLSRTSSGSQASLFPYSTG